MDQNQRNQVQSSVDAFYNLNIDEIFASTYKSKKNLKTTMVGPFSALDLLVTIKEVYEQFREELSTTYVNWLPFQYHFQNEFGNGNLPNDLNQINAHLIHRQIPNIVGVINRLVHYQIVNGIWGKANRNYLDSTENIVNEANKSLSAVASHLEKITEETQSRFDGIDKKSDELTNLIKQKLSELSEITSLLDASRIHTNEINESNNHIASVSEKINAQHDMGVEKISGLDKLLEEESLKSNNYNQASEANIANLEKSKGEFLNLVKNFTEKLTFVESKEGFFRERNEHLENLIGREVGASLFETFKQRKVELNSSVNFWKYSVPITAVLTVAWIFFLFGNGSASEITPILFGINTLKSIPVVFLLLFSISQYTKERNFQEEYAFKSAVALTVNAYADQLKSDENKDSLIIESVNAIYKTPLSSPKERKSEDRKSVLEATKGLVDVAKELAKGK